MCMGVCIEFRCGDEGKKVCMYRSLVLKISSSSLGKSNYRMINILVCIKLGVVIKITYIIMLISNAQHITLHNFNFE